METDMNMKRDTNVNKDFSGKDLADKKLSAAVCKKAMVDFWEDETGAGVVEMILIIVVLIALVVLFRETLQDVVERILKKISDNADAV